MKKELQKLGLSEYKTRALAATLELGACSITQISRKSGLPTSKLYEIVSDLSRRGFVRVIQQRPLRIEPSEFETALKNYVESKKADLDAIHKELAALQTKSIAKTTQFEVVNSRDGFFVRVKSAVSSSKKEICAVVRNYRLDFDLKQRVSEFTKNGGRLRLIGPNVSADKTKYWIEAGAHIRFIDVPSTRFTVWDGQRTAIGFKDQSYDYFSLWINDSVVGKSFQKMFDEYWNDASASLYTTKKSQKHGRRKKPSGKAA